MKCIYPVVFIFSVFLGSAHAGESPYNYLNANFGIGMFSSPLIYTYSLDYSRDVRLSDKSSLSFGLEWDNYYQHHEYVVDTNFSWYGNPTGSTIEIKYYFRNNMVMALNPSIGYKLWLRNSKSSAIYIESKIEIVFDIREVNKYEYYYRDSSQSLHLGPFSGTSKEIEYNKEWTPDNLKPAFSVGYLKTINKHLAYHFKLEVILAIPDQNPGDLALLFPKLGFGIAFR